MEWVDVLRLMPILFFLFIFFCPGVTAEDTEEIDILDFLDMLLLNQWNGDFSTLNYKATDPAAVWVPGPHMVAWVDIVGYRNMSRINNTDYILGDPVGCVIVESEVVDLLTWNDNLDWIDKQISYNISNGNITAILDVTMLWHHSTEITRPNGQKGVKKDYNYEYMTITDSERLPLQYNYTSANKQTTIIFYNNTFSPKTFIDVPGKDGLYYIEYSYSNETIRQNLMNAGIEKNQKGIEFINFTEVEKWEDPEGNLSHLAGSCVIKGANFTLEDLNISLKTPYSSFNVTDHNLTINNVSAGSCINLSIFPFIFVVGLLLSTTYIIIKKTWG